MCHPSFTADTSNWPTLMTVKDPPALGMLCKTHHTSTHQLLCQWELLLCLNTLSFLLTMQIERYLFSRHIPEMLKEGKCTNIAYENSSSGTANTFIKSERHYSTRTVAVISFLVVKLNIFHPIHCFISLVGAPAFSHTAQGAPQLPCT